MLFVAWVIFHVLVCIALVLVVLMQSSKGEGLAGGTAFGGGVSGAVFGGRGAASFLSKATTVLAVLFMLNCGALAFMSSQTREAVVATPGTPTDAESAVTQKAQEEMDAMQQQLDAQQAEQLGEDLGVGEAGGQPIDQQPAPSDEATEENTDGQ